MSRTIRRASRRNHYAKHPDWRGRINTRSMRDGKTIRGCNSDDCDYCAGNRTHRDNVRAMSAQEQIEQGGDPGWRQF